MTVKVREQGSQITKLNELVGAQQAEADG